jgi:hypothetical protein
LIQKRIGLAIVLIAIGGTGLLLIGSLSTGTFNLDQALTIAESYSTSQNIPDLAIDEVMEFEQNFYIIYNEKSTGIGAFEMLIDKSTGRIFPEYGPNMMWNTKYGHGGMMGDWNGMNGSPLLSGPMLIEEEKAVEIAQDFLDGVYLETFPEDPHPFYGYYTIHVTKDGEIYGMLSVNGYDGSVWYHNWHGAYIQSVESH